MRKCSETEARLFIQFVRERFVLASGSPDFDAAGLFFGVSPWTVRRWYRENPPSFALRMVHLASRALPDTDDWRGFWFGKDGRLYAPVDRLSFSGSELNFQFFERQFARNDRTARAKLEKQLTALRSEAERKAIIEEIEDVLKVLKKIQGTALLAPIGKFYHS